ncbi:MAG: 5-(carboxyamino)imidazole ribonucleotide synthase [Candidatus Symbiodolus clandestinus]
MSSAIWVIGNGQLGQMLRQAGEPLGLAVYPKRFDEPLARLPETAVVTTEIEQWPNTSTTSLLSHHPGFANLSAIQQLADRYRQKQLLDTLQLPTAPWVLLRSVDQWSDLFTKWGEPLVVKCRQGGYDGRGQWRVYRGEQQLPDTLYGQAIVEAYMPFDTECSIIGARSRQGDIVCYPLTYNYHQAGILRASVAFPEPESPLQSLAEQLLRTVMQHFDYRGVLAIECFVIKGKLLINELAPRVHNSGHWTQTGASISQFSLHLRALCDWPMPQPMVSQPSVMLNLIGNSFNPQWLAHPLVQLYWYGKAVRPGRKLGHINFSHLDKNILQSVLYDLQTQLSDEAYSNSLQWLQQKLSH